MEVKNVALLVFTAACWVCGVGASEQPSYIGTSVTTKSGAEVLRYTGIRFAEPPVGERRWRAPVAYQASGSVDATAWHPISVQDNGNAEWYQDVAKAFGAPPEFIHAMPENSEDCLFLNIWTPDVDARLPVLVWIHGGGNVNGFAYEPNYLGHELAARGVVVVSIQYRLGVFGFLAHPELSAESAHQSSGNYGILDQVEALRWIRRNITAFGGNPENVTLFGESAGAGDIAYLMLSPLSAGLFHRGISQSGGWPANQLLTVTDDEAEGARFLATAEIEDIEALRALPAETVFELAEQHFERGYDDPPIDGWLLPASPAELLRRKEFERRPFIVGTNAQEVLMYLRDPTEDDWREALHNTADSAAVAALLANRSLPERLDALRSARQFHCPSLALANGFAAAGAPTFVYRLHRVRPGKHGLGAYHGAEIPYLFDTHDLWLPTVEIDRALTERMMGYWLNFAATGDPNYEGAANWPRWSEGGEALLLNDETAAASLDTRLCTLL